jgi:hypothetical protein
MAIKTDEQRIQRLERQMAIAIDLFIELYGSVGQLMYLPTGPVSAEAKNHLTKKFENISMYLDRLIKEMPE